MFATSRPPPSAAVAAADLGEASVACGPRARNAGGGIPIIAGKPRNSRLVERDGFGFADLRIAGSAPDRIPAWIPPEARQRLDLGELELEDENALRERDRLEHRLALHVAAYRRGAQGRPPRGLCSVYRAAELSASQLACIEEAEARFANVIFVAYARPLEARSDPGQAGTLTSP